MHVERQILRRSENLWKKFRNEFADHYIGVSNGQRSLAAVTFRAGIGSGRVGTDTETRAIEMQDRTAAGGDRMDEHHRSAHAHAGNLCFECPLILAVEMRNVGRRSAHVEADETIETRLTSGFRHADDASSRT